MLAVVSADILINVQDAVFLLLTIVLTNGLYATIVVIDNVLMTYALTVEES